MYNGHKHVTPINSLWFFFFPFFSASATILQLLDYHKPITKKVQSTVLIILKYITMNNNFESLFKLNLYIIG